MSGKTFAIAAAVCLFASQAQAQEASVEQKPSLLSRFAGSSVGLGYYFDAIALDKGAEMSYNPTVAQSINFDPRFKIAKGLSVAAHVDLSTELTNSDDTSYKNQTLLSDTTLRVGYTHALPAEVTGSASLTLIFPTSKESQARERIIGLAPGVAFSREFKIGDKVSVSPNVSGRVTWHGATARSLTYDAPTITTCDPSAESCNAFTYSGARSTQASFREAIGVDFSFPFNLSAAVSVQWMQNLLYGLDEAIDPVTGEVIPPSEANVDWRYVMAYQIGAEWKPIPRLAVGLGVTTANPQQAPDSSYYAPFFNRYTQIFGELRLEY
jgi:hypothetical protein